MTAPDRAATGVTRRERRAQARAGRPRPRPGTPARRRSALLSPFGLVTVAAVVVAVALVAFAALSAPARPQAGSGLVDPAEGVPVGFVDGQAIGGEGSPVVLEVYGDYQCPVCGRFARDYLPRLVADYVVPGTLRIVDRPIAFLGTGNPDESLDAAVGAVCAGRQDRYWAYHDLLMANQDGENEGAFSRQVLAAMADRSGLDRAAWDDCFADRSVAAQLRADTAAAGAAGITSTPTFVLNGQRIVGLVAYEELAGAIDALATAAR